MCTDEQHQQKMDELRTLVKCLVYAPPEDANPMISANRPYVIDYKGRRHLFLYSANTLTLSLEDLGSVTVPQNTWINIGFQPGMRIFATGQATNVPIFVRATNEVLP